MNAINRADTTRQTPNPIDFFHCIILIVIPRQKDDFTSNSDTPQQELVQKEVSVGCPTDMSDLFKSIECRTNPEVSKRTQNKKTTINLCLSTTIAFSFVVVVVIDVMMNVKEQPVRYTKHFSEGLAFATGWIEQWDVVALWIVVRFQISKHEHTFVLVLFRVVALHSSLSFCLLFAEISTIKTNQPKHIDLLVGSVHG